MPCPFFEPQRVTARPENARCRLPLIDEYDGLCHASTEPFTPEAALRFRCCNHGYSSGACAHFPDDEAISAVRFHLTGRNRDTLALICVEERNYAPIRWYPVEYVVSTGQLQPEIIDKCVQAQVIAFCRSHLEHFPD